MTPRKVAEKTFIFLNRHSLPPYEKNVDMCARAFIKVGELSLYIFCFPFMLFSLLHHYIDNIA